MTVYRGRLKVLEDRPRKARFGGFDPPEPKAACPHCGGLFGEHLPECSVYDWAREQSAPGPNGEPPRSLAGRKPIPEQMRDEERAERSLAGRAAFVGVRVLLVVLGAGAWVAERIWGSDR